MDDVKAKQQIVDKIKEATNILITVSNDPSVDALSAALGLSLLIDKLDKHPTAVVSGKIPPAITFLEPEKTFENTTDSLRDFIIALDKDKADHLRVKPEGDVVKIYVTPYRTTITSDDLSFSQGDYNVEMVIALGVDVQEHLDSALDSHGKILHDATIVSISAGDVVSNVGSIDWHDDKASSLSEMVASLADSLKKDKPLLDKQLATAFLTGIVAETDRFSNTRTTSKAMTIAATLMSAGADPQLIASKLEDDGDDEPIETPSKPDEPKPTEDSGDVLNISHKPHNEPGETLEEMDKRIKADEQREAAEEANKELKEEIETQKVTPVAEISHAEPAVAEVHSSLSETETPSFGGTLNATADEAEEDNRQALEDDQNKTILSHAYVGPAPNAAPSMSGATVDNGDANFVDPLSQPSTNDDVHSAYAFEPEQHQEVAPLPTLEPTPIGMPASPVAPTPAPVIPPAPADLGLPMPPPLPDFSVQPPAIDPAYSLDPVVPPVAPLQPERLGDILAPETPAAPTTPPASNDPGQFKIPGQ